MKENRNLILAGSPAEGEEAPLGGVKRHSSLESVQGRKHLYLLVFKGRQHSCNIDDQQ